MYLLIRKEIIQDLGLECDGIFKDFLLFSLWAKENIIPFPLNAVSMKKKMVNIHEERHMPFPNSDSFKEMFKTIATKGCG